MKRINVFLNVKICMLDQISHILPVTFVQEMIYTHTHIYILTNIRIKFEKILSQILIRKPNYYPKDFRVNLYLDGNQKYKLLRSISPAFTSMAINHIDSTPCLCGGLTTGQQELNERRMCKNSQQLQKAVKENQQIIIILEFHYVCDHTSLGLSISKLSLKSQTGASL